ncbi:hypothetical protein [Ensifer adhaerens]|uniref:hypothetical protein n=1 Tax=Ensifer adhaerens TaxID=106592 RepID=UPI001C4E0294|nr:hypothetical protein [Ensifer adhaerens]MBW0367918.1 hypothetical protein [Ensifer adhaerens]UCM24480.1 hypothetical protein LDL63_32745 [Ensifer adhaerens]
MNKENFLAIQDRVGLFGNDNEGKTPTLSAETIYRVMDSFVGKWPKCRSRAAHLKANAHIGSLIVLRGGLAVTLPRASSR